MSNMVHANIAFIIWMGTASLASAIIYRKGHKLLGAIVIGLLLGPLSLLIALLIPYRNNTPQS
jgi:1,4-dihydroxy-2-naphthoate octaprenyltransferase